MSPLGKVEMSPFVPRESNLKRLLHDRERTDVKGVINYEHEGVRTIISSSEGN